MFQIMQIGDYLTLQLLNNSEYISQSVDADVRRAIRFNATQLCFATCRNFPDWQSKADFLKKICH